MQKAPASATALASADDLLRFVGALAARAIAAEHIDRLRGQADMADHRNAAMGQEVDGRRHRLAAFQLDRRAAGFLHDPRRAGERLFGRAFIASERHVDRDQRVPAAAHHRGAMGAHHLHRHRHGRRQAVDHLAQAVADQQHLAMRVEQLRHPHRVGGQHDDRLLGLAVLLARRGSPARSCACRAPASASRGWSPYRW